MNFNATKSDSVAFTPKMCMLALPIHLIYKHYNVP